VPVAAPESVEALRSEADEIVCLLEPEPMVAVGLWYAHFEPPPGAEIATVLSGEAADPPSRGFAHSSERRIPAGIGVQIVGDLAVPEVPLGLVVFAHGSGSSRHSPRNRQVARTLNERRSATLLLDLLTDGASPLSVYLRPGQLGSRLRTAAAALQTGPPSSSDLAEPSVVAEAQGVR